MRVPDAESAFVPLRKVVKYLLGLEHPTGRSKARWLIMQGFSPERPAELIDALCRHVLAHEVRIAEETRFGMRYTVEGSLGTPTGIKEDVRTIWFIDESGDPPRFVTMFPTHGRNS